MWNATRSTGGGGGIDNAGEAVSQALALQLVAYCLLSPLNSCVAGAEAGGGGVPRAGWDRNCYTQEGRTKSEKYEKWKNGSDWRDGKEVRKNWGKRNGGPRLKFDPTDRLPLLTGVVCFVAQSVWGQHLTPAHGRCVLRPCTLSLSSPSNS
jgi:hypothetical protein